ncbi:MAG TPA: DUF72 domain-containing protein [Gaiellaceae bacterium]|nr:DUF72 domain-containing protein [Gaiellaceae bacterium]
MDSIVDLLSVGTSGWSYPSWRPGFYRAGVANEDFLHFYAERFTTVELNTTGYRLPSEEQFARWAQQTPPGFRFAPKLPQRSLRSLGTFEERVRRLGDRLGPVRVVVESPRDDGLLALLLGSTGLRLALDLRDPSWADVDVRPAVRVDDRAADGPFRYLRFRDPPYDDEALHAIAAELRPLLGAGVEVFAYFRHEDEPTAPAYAARLRELVDTS